MPKVLNVRDLPHTAQGDPIIPKWAVYVGRPSKWGNPYHEGRHGTRAQVIEKYRVWLDNHPELIRSAQIQLAARDLVCWCAPLPCHADILLAVANEGMAPETPQKP